MRMLSNTYYFQSTPLKNFGLVIRTNWSTEGGWNKTTKKSEKQEATEWKQLILGCMLMRVTIILEYTKIKSDLRSVSVLQAQLLC